MVNAVLADGNIPQSDDKKREAVFLDEVTKIILSIDADAEKELIKDMRLFNLRGNSESGLYDIFWECCARALDLENGSDAHHRRHAAIDEETTKNISYTPGILSIPQLICTTVKLLEKDDKVKEVDFEVPSETWVYMQFPPNNEYKSNPAFYT